MEAEEGQGYSIPVNPYGQEKGLLQFQIDNEEIIEDIKHNIMYETPVANVQTGEVEWKNLTGEPPMINRIGLQAVESRLRSRMTKVFALSRFDEHQIESLSNTFAQGLIDELADKWEHYEVRSPSDASNIVDICVDNFLAILMKAKEGYYLRFLRTSQIVNESTVLKEDKKPQMNSFEESRKSLPFNPFWRKK